MVVDGDGQVDIQTNHFFWHSFLVGWIIRLAMFSGDLCFVRSLVWAVCGLMKDLHSANNGKKKPL